MICVNNWKMNYIRNTCRWSSLPESLPPQIQAINCRLKTTASVLNKYSLYLLSLLSKQYSLITTYTVLGIINNLEMIYLFCLLSRSILFAKRQTHSTFTFCLVCQQAFIRSLLWTTSYISPMDEMCEQLKDVLGRCVLVIRKYSTILRIWYLRRVLQSLHPVDTEAWCPLP
jgi:hypothetical protein